MLEMILDLVTENFLDIIIGIITLLVSYYVLPMIKNDLVPWLQEKRLYNIVVKFVQAAEKLAESGIIEKVDKKPKVIELLNEYGIEVDETMEAFIESAVKELDLITSTARDEIMKETEIENEVSNVQ